MNAIIQDNLENKINPKEKKLLQSVLEKYDFQVYNINKLRSSYKIETDKGNICLNKMSHYENKTNNGNLLVKELIHNNFINTSKYIYTKEGLVSVNINKLVFYATE